MPMPMQMVFNGTSAYLEYLLFKTWKVDGWLPCRNSTDSNSHVCKYWWQSMIFAIVAIFLLGFATEALSVLRVKLYKLQRLNPLKRALESSRSSSDPINQEETPVSSSSTSLLAPLRIPSSVAKIKMRRFRFHIVQSVVYMVYRFAGYLLMLAVMSFNMYIFLAVVLGLGFSYFFLAPTRHPKALDASIEDSHAHGSRHGEERGVWSASGSHGYSYGTL